MLEGTLAFTYGKPCAEDSPDTRENVTHHSNSGKPRQTGQEPAASMPCPEHFLPPTP